MLPKGATQGGEAKMSVFDDAVAVPRPTIDYR